MLGPGKSARPRLPEKSNPDYYVHSSRSGLVVLGLASGISRLGAKT
jgi:hypothetical protein